MPKDVFSESGVHSVTKSESERFVSDQVAFQYLLDEFLELKTEIAKLNKDVLKSRKRITQLEKRKKSYGNVVTQRMGSMLVLLEDYGGSMSTSDIKSFMGLSKDELYRTLKCARDNRVVELFPNPDDRRGYVVQIKSNVIQIPQSSLSL